MQFHQNFPYGIGIWIWQIWECVGRRNITEVTPDDINVLVKKCKEDGLDYVIVKCGDGENTWVQFTPELIKAFHDAGIKIYSWSFVYGDNPLREAAIAMWALDMGVDGHVFDAESQYQGKAASANTMLQAVRNHASDAFLAYAPFPIIDYHEDYPYIEFGKYCDCVMPQIYAGDLQMGQRESVEKTAAQFSKWQDIWKAGGFSDSVKPIIPLGQAYDNPEVKYVQNGEDTKEFIEAARGYLSVCFWSFEHIYQQEVWDAIKNNHVDPQPDKQLDVSPAKIEPTDKVNEEAIPADTSKGQPPAQQQEPSPEKTESVLNSTNTGVLPAGGTGGTGQIAVKTEDPSKIFGINSGRSIQSKTTKKHIDYVREFIILILKGLHLI